MKTALEWFLKSSVRIDGFSSTARWFQNGRLVLAVVVALCTAGRLPAHHCGPQVLTLKAGETCPWRITADRTEEKSHYAAAMVGDPAISSVIPLGSFDAIHGDFIITGLRPGTNRLEVFWGYDGPPPAAGFCFVEIRVTAADPGEQAFPNIPGSLTSFRFYGDTDASELSTWLNAHIPAAAKKLLVLTECYGGSIALSSEFRNAPNTIVLSATVPNQTAKYGGYHDDAARALRPGEGRTSKDVHETATRGIATSWSPAIHGLAVDKRTLRESGEWPVFSGGLAMEDFSLASVTNGGAVQSRHIIIYMGHPEARTSIVEQIEGVTIPNPGGNPTTISDNADRDAIKAAFSGERNTTVRTVGGEADPANPEVGVNGWDLPGDQEGLLKAIIEAGGAISNSPNPSAEQFILFVGDHGQQGSSILSGPVILPVSAGTELSINWKAPGLGDTLGYTWKLDQGNKVSLGFKVEDIGANQRAQAAAGQLMPGPGDFTLEILPAGQPAVTLTEFVIQPFDINGGGQVGDWQGEYWKIYFPVEEDFVLGSLSAASPGIRLHNHTTTQWQLRDFKLFSGAIRRDSSPVPRPLIESVRMLSPTRLELRIYGPPGDTFVLESSTNLGTWSFRQNVTFFSQIMTLTQTVSGPGPLFFRLRWTGQ